MVGDLRNMVWGQLGCHLEGDLGNIGLTGGHMVGDMGTKFKA